MPIPIPWPLGLTPFRCEFYLQNNTTQFSSPITRSQQVLRRQGERWVGTAAFRLRRSEAQLMDATLAKLKGAYNTANIWDFARPAPLNGTPPSLSALADSHFIDAHDFSDATWFDGGAAVGPIVYRDYSLGETIVGIYGFPQYALAFKAGDYVSLNSKLYMLTEDAVADGTGHATLYLNRGLLAALTSAMVVGYLKPSAEMRLIDDTQPNRAIAVDDLYQYTLSFVEAL